MGGEAIGGNGMARRKGREETGWGLVYVELHETAPLTDCL